MITSKSQISERKLNNGALSGRRYRVIVSTDIGGTDPDDFQSMVHLLVYADCFDIEGLISSSGISGPGRKRDIFDVIDCYEQDYDNLKKHSDNYPTPDALRALTKQGETEMPLYAGFQSPTEGSKWIITCARRDDLRPLYILGWGGIEDIAQALHDAPDILPKLRVYWVGGPNKKWGPHQYQYVVENHPDLWIIEVNSTYRGWFMGGNQSGQWGNTEFVKRHIAGKGTLGEFFNSKLGGTIKMGDTPSVGWLLKGTPEDPSQPSWGGNFVRAWERPHLRLDHLPTEIDHIAEFGILELVLPLGEGTPTPEAILDVENQSLDGYAPGDGTMRFRFCPKAARVFQFTIRSNVPALNGQTGAITAYTPNPEIAQHPTTHLPNWWTDNPAPEFADNVHQGMHRVLGSKSVNQWRADYLRDFAKRMERCVATH